MLIKHPQIHSSAMEVVAKLSKGDRYTSVDGFCVWNCGARIFSGINFRSQRGINFDVGVGVGSGSAYGRGEGRLAWRAGRPRQKRSRTDLTALGTEIEHVLGMAQWQNDLVG